MRVLYEHRTQASCAEGEHIRGVVSAFRSLGHEVELVEPPSVNSQQLGASLTDRVAPTKRRVVRKLLSFIASHLPEVAFEVCELGYNLLEVPRLLWECTQFRPDLLYARYSLFTAAPAIAARLAGIPLVLEINDATFIERSRPLAMRRLARRIESGIFRRASLCVTISRLFADLACSEHKVDRDRILVVPNAVTPERFTPLSVPEAEHPPVLGVVGAFVPWHGLDFLVAAVACLRTRNPDLRVLLVGDGPIRPTIEAQVHEHGLGDVVEFTGFVPPSEVPSLLRKMDVCIIPDSNNHGSPMKLFEYMAMAKATVAPRYPPIEEVVEDGATGLLFAPRDLEDFCRQTEKLLRDPSRRRRIGQRARAAVLESHTWEANVRRVLGVLETLDLRHRGKVT
jgi:glycosyltransferase involved in cell wall biosynthesis